MPKKKGGFKKGKTVPLHQLEKVLPKDPNPVEEPAKQEVPKPAAAAPSGADVFASWNPKLTSGPEWENTERPDASGELVALRNLYALETKINAEEKETAAKEKTAVPAKEKTAVPAKEKTVAAKTETATGGKPKVSAADYQEGHYHYIGCPLDNYASYESRACDCYAKISAHNDQLLRMAKASSGRVRTERVVAVRSADETPKREREQEQERRDSHKKQRNMPLDLGSPLDQLAARQNAILAGCDDLEKRMWQHLAHRQEKINANLDSLSKLYDSLSHFDDDDATKYLQEDEPEKKKRMLEKTMSMEVGDDAKRRKKKEVPEVKKEKKRSRKGKTATGTLRYEVYNNERFDSNTITHMVKDAATALARQLPKVAECAYRITGFNQQAPNYFVKLSFETPAGTCSVHALLRRAERNMQPVTVVGVIEAACAETVPPALLKLS